MIIDGIEYSADKGLYTYRLDNGCWEAALAGKSGGFYKDSSPCRDTAVMTLFTNLKYNHPDVWRENMSYFEGYFSPSGVIDET